MKNIKETDRIIRNKLKNHAVEAPDYLWDKIEAKRAVAVVVEETASGGSKKWLLLLLLFVSGAGGWLFLQSNKESKIVQEDTMSILPSTINKENNQQTTIQEKSNIDLVSPKNQAAIVAENVATNQSTNKLEISKNKITTELNTPKAPLEDSSQKINQDIDNRQISMNAPVATATSITTGIESMPRTATSAKTATTETELGEKNAIKNGSFLKDLNYLPNEFISLDVNPLPLGSLPDPKCAKFGNSSFGFDAYLDWFISPDYAFRTLKATDAASVEEAEQRDKSESFLYAYSTGIRFSAVAENGLAFRSGISYSQINEKFDYVNANETRISIKNEFNTNGEIISSDTTIQKGTHVKTSYNRYRMIDIPLILGYEVESKNFVYSVNGGVYLNLLFTQKGDFLGENGPVNFTSNRTDSYRAFKDKLGFSLFGSFGFNYKLGKYMQILIEPNMRYHLNPINNKDYKIDQSYITAGLITGVRLKF